MVPRGIPARGPPSVTPATGRRYQLLATHKKTHFPERK